MKDLKIEEYFANGIELAKKNYWQIFLRTLVTSFLSVAAAVTIVGIFLLPAIMGGFYKFLLKTARGESDGIMDSWLYGFQNGMWWKTLLLLVISLIAMICGFLLLVIPGIYLATVWLLAWFLLVDNEILPTDSLQQSRELVHSLGFWKVFGVYAILTIIIQIISAIPLSSVSGL